MFTATNTGRLPGWPESTSGPSQPYVLYIPPATYGCDHPLCSLHLHKDSMLALLSMPCKECVWACMDTS